MNSGHFGLRHMPETARHKNHQPTEEEGEERLTTSMRDVFRKIVLLIYLVLLILPPALQTVGNISHKSYLLALLVSCVLFAGIWFSRRMWKGLLGRINGGNAVMHGVILSILCLLVNGGFAFFFRPVQAADYRTFFQVAKDLSQGIHPGMKDYVAMFPHILGYSSFLSMFLKLFGQSLAVAVGVNVALTTLSGIILFYLVYRQTDLSSAALVYLLWILCPSKMFYNTMSLSEPYYTFLMLLFFLLLRQMEALTMKGGRERFAGIVLLAVACGMILTFVQTARPIAAIPIIALALWCGVLMDGETLRKHWKEWLLLGAVLILTYRVGTGLWRSYATEQLEQAPPSVPGYNIYVGFNLETEGSYSDADMDLLQSRYFGEYERNAEAAQQRMLQDAKLRIGEAKPVMLHLMLTKLRKLLGHDEGGVFYAMESLSGGQYRICCILSNIWYYLIVLFAACGCMAIWKWKESGSVLVWILFVIGLILAQLLVEVAARYHYALIPILLMIAGYAFEHSAKQTNEIK